jgi:REP element-mobilizing transposase RayT
MEILFDIQCFASGGRAALAGPRGGSFLIVGFSPGNCMYYAPQQIRTFFITSVTHGRCPILQTEKMALLLLDVLMENRNKRRFLLHEFVIMRDHFHVILTPSEDVSLEKAVQFIKGGFSYRAKRETSFCIFSLAGEFYQSSYSGCRGLCTASRLCPPEPSESGFCENAFTVSVFFGFIRP